MGGVQACCQSCQRNTDGPIERIEKTCLPVRGEPLPPEETEGCHRAEVTAVATRDALPEGKAARSKLELIGSASSFPTYCLPMEYFMGMDLMAAHEELLNVALMCPPDDAVMHFISHEWLSFTHPDPAGTQLNLMQEISFRSS